MAPTQRQDRKVAETATAVWADGALSLDLPENATLADVAERVTAHAEGRRPLYVSVTLSAPTTTQH
jgi:hypothetical protein